MKVNHALRVFAPALSKDTVARSISRGYERIGWYRDDIDILKKKEYMSILVGFSLMLVVTECQSYNMRREGL